MGGDEKVTWTSCGCVITLTDWGRAFYPVLGLSLTGEVASPQLYRTQSIGHEEWMFACFEQAQWTFNAATIGDYGDTGLALEEMF